MSSNCWKVFKVYSHDQTN